MDNIRELYNLADYDWQFLSSIFSIVSFDVSINSFDDEITSFGKQDKQILADILLLIRYLVVDLDDFDIFGGYPRGTKFKKLSFEEFKKIYDRITVKKIIDKELFDIFSVDFYLQKKQVGKVPPTNLSREIQKIFCHIH